MNARDDIEGDVGHPLDRPLHRCPSCGSTHLIAIVDDGAVHFYCDECARCWHVELGAVWRVNPNTCASCAHYERCAKTYAADHARPSRERRHQ